jgi:hypothetical protein
MQIDKAQIIELLKSQGKDDKVSQAESELPDKVGKLGGGALGGLGGLGG